MAMRDGEFPWAIGATPNQQLAHLLSSYFDDPKYVKAAYEHPSNKSGATE